MQTFLGVTSGQSTPKVHLIHLLFFLFYFSQLLCLKEHLSPGWIPLLVQTGLCWLITVMLVKWQDLE